MARNNVIPMYSKISLAELFVNMNTTQQHFNKDVKNCLIVLKRENKWLKAFVIALFLAVIAMGIGGYMGFQKFEKDIKPEIEQSYPVPVEMLKEV